MMDVKRVFGAYMIVLTVVVLIIAGGVISQRYLQRSADSLAAELKDAKALMEQDNWDEAEESFDRFVGHWRQVRRYWAMFTDHFELDNIDMKLVRAREFIRTRDAVNASAEFGEAVQLLEHIPERERLTLNNIF